MAQPDSVARWAARSAIEGRRSTRVLDSGYRHTQVRTESETKGRIAIAAGPIVALIAAGILSRFRDSAGSANVALVLTAALGYNFFHTKPYNSLQISSVHDVLTVVFLVVIGVTVGEISAWRRRTKATSVRTHHGAEAFEVTASLLAAKTDPDRVWSEVRRAIIDTLGLTECRFEPGLTPSVPPLSRSGSLVAASMHFTVGGFQLPEAGASIAVTFAGRVYGHVIIVGSPDSLGSSLDERRISIALVDQYAVALGMNESAGWHP
jgi:hypothetical protein